MLLRIAFVLAIHLAYGGVAVSADSTLVLVDNLITRETHSIFFKYLQGLPGCQCNLRGELFSCH